MIRPRVIGPVLVTALLAWLVVQSTESREPRYAGRRLTQWLADYQMKIWQGRFGPGGDDWAKDGPIEFAVREIGTNGIPTMVQLLRAHDSKAKSLLLDLFDKQPMVRFPFKRDYQKHQMAWLGFSLLGTKAAAACYELATFAGSADESSRMRALHSLKEIQPPREFYVRALLKFLHDSNPYTQHLAAEELGRIAPEEAGKAGVYEMFPEPRAADSDQAQPNKAQQDAPPNAGSADAPPASMS